MYIFKKGEKTVIKSYFDTKFCNVSRIIYKPFDIFTRIIIVTIESYIKPVGEIDI